MLEELGVPFEMTVVEIRRGDGSGKRDERNPHPHGKVPIIEHDGVLVHELAAIATHLADSFPQARMGPPVGDPRRGTFLTWLVYYAGVLEPSAASKMLSWEVPRGTAAWVDLGEVMPHVDATLQRQPYIAGEEFTLADVLYGGAFEFFGRNPAFSMSPSIKAYVERCVTRPARARALARDSG